MALLDVNRDDYQAFIDQQAEAYLAAAREAGVIQ
jgi:hypothetical protein